MANIVTENSPEHFYKDKPHIPTGYSFQTGKVHSSWSDLEDTVKKQAEARGENAVFERDGDYRKMKGTRYKLHCGKVQVKYSECEICHGVVE